MISLKPHSYKKAQGSANFKAGIVAEKIARWLLLLKGYKIIKRRYQTPSGEIDLLACKGAVLIAIEVKKRLKTEDALSAISPRQQQRIRNALLFAHKRYHRFSDLRIDTILISPFKWPIHIKNAF